MKKILITGKNSYIGKELKFWLDKFPKLYKVNFISVRDIEWKNYDFSEYDVLVHLAGIVHNKQLKKKQDIYNNINRDLTFSLAQKAKTQGIKQFIFMSTMNVYGVREGIITGKTIPKPKSHYGRSKLEAEKKIKCLETPDFKVAIIRPPMVYGKKCPGNYKFLSKLAICIPIFPDISNQRSMIFIDNLSEAIRQVIETKARGIFFPQNLDYVTTTEMVKSISKLHGKKVKLTKFLNPLVHLLDKSQLGKAFGSLIYDKKLPRPKQEYITFEESMVRTESKKNFAS